MIIKNKTKNNKKVRRKYKIITNKKVRVKRKSKRTNEALIIYWKIIIIKIKYENKIKENN